MLRKDIFLFETRVTNIHIYICVQKQIHYSLSTYSNKRSSLNKMTDDRIRNVWNNGVLVEGQTDTTNPEAEERITHHHLYRYFTRHLKQKSTHLVYICYETTPYYIQYTYSENIFFLYLVTCYDNIFSKL